MRERGGIAPIPHGGDDKYKFLHHEHQLSLISSPSSHHHQSEDEEDDRERSELICNGCITPIFSEMSYYYMSCSECEYYLHWPCFNLPPQLPSLPLHNKPDHELVLESCPKLTRLWYCFVCGLYSNGLFYTCRKCYFKADVKCASLLPTVHHEAHPQHLLAYVGMEDLSFPRLQCAADCEYPSLHYPSYACRGCEFLLHVGCALLPPSVRSDRWDRQHVLPLTHNANLNHRGEFYCDECETEMNPKSWMYHCRHCDLSFHPHCFRTASGYYRNVKFGGKYAIDLAHQHPLAFSPVNAIVTSVVKICITNLDFTAHRATSSFVTTFAMKKCSTRATFKPSIDERCSDSSCTAPFMLRLMLSSFLIVSLFPFLLSHNFPTCSITTGDEDE